MFSRKKIRLFLTLGFCCLLSTTGCLSKSDREVVVYAALDKEFSDPILMEFQFHQDIRVLSKYDTESNKTVGLAAEIIQHQQRPRCDVFWNNEILHTLRLRKLGLLASYRSPLADQYPSQFVSSDGTWHGFAARARVLIVNTELVSHREDWPTSIHDLAKPQWKNNCAIARPLFGTTASHAAVLFSQWGDKDAFDFFKKVRENAIVEGGNKQVAVNVARGRYAFGLTDTDDAIIEKDRGAAVEIIFPDQGEGQMGCLQIPNTLAIIKGGPNSENAKRLVDHLLQAEIEERLAKGASAQIPLNKNVTVKSRAVVGKARWMNVDFEKAADRWDESRAKLIKLFPVGG